MGAAYLAQRRDFVILPISINYFWGKTNVNWGRPFKIDDKMKTKDLNELTEMIFNRVLQLAD